MSDVLLVSSVLNDWLTLAPQECQKTPLVPLPRCEEIVYDSRSMRMGTGQQNHPLQSQSQNQTEPRRHDGHHHGWLTTVVVRSDRSSRRTPPPPYGVPAAEWITESQLQLLCVWLCGVADLLHLEQILSLIGLGTGMSSRSRSIHYSKS